MLIVLVPYRGFSTCARTLDKDLLLKNLHAAEDILGNMNRDILGVNMWRGVEHILCTYGAVMAWEWYRRTGEAYPNTFIEKKEKRVGWPSWIWDEMFLESHRSNMKRRKSKTYAHFEEPDWYPYLWPVNHKEGDYSLILEQACEIPEHWKD